MREKGLCHEWNATYACLKIKIVGVSHRNVTLGVTRGLIGLSCQDFFKNYFIERRKSFNYKMKKPLIFLKNYNFKNEKT